MGTIKDWPEPLQAKWRAMCARGGKNGSKADKKRAGKLGGLARVKKAKENSAMHK